MKRFLISIILVGVLVASGPAAALNVQGSAPNSPATQGEAGLPGWNLPAKPIPHQKPGQPSRAGNAAAQVSRLSADGAAETVQLTGLDALLADGTISDPLQGNYTVVKHDDILFGGYSYGSTNQFSATSYSYGDGQISQYSNKNFANAQYSKVATGDLNGDLIDEQIVAWLNPDTNHYMMTIGEVQGGEESSQGKQTTSAPATAAYADGSLDVVVRGYDDALWYLHNNGTTWGSWDNNAGGILLSGPAAASRAAGQMDVFAIWVNNQLAHNLWNGSSWSGWNLMDATAVFPVTQASVPLQDVLSPAVVARNASTLDVFRVADDHTLYWLSSGDGGASWGAWTSLGGMLASAPAAVSLGNNRVLAGAMGADGAFWFRLYNGSAWGGWQRVEVPDEVAGNALPALASPNPGQAALYLAGSENHLWASLYNANGSAWSGWNDIPVVGAQDTPTLGAGVGAAGSAGALHVFAQATNGRLYTPGSNDTWDRLDPLPETVEVDTSLSVDANNCGDGDLVTQCFFDVATGYFSGDGRQQIALAYVQNLASNQVQLAVFDIQDGFRLHKVANLDAPLSPARTPRIAAGDVNGDGLDEIGLVYEVPINQVNLAVYQVDKTLTGDWAGSLSQLGTTQTWGETYSGFTTHFAGTLVIAAGDIIPEDEGDPISDEFAILSDWALPGYNAGGYVVAYDWVVDVRLFDYHPGTDTPDCQRYLRWALNSSDQIYWNQAMATGAGLAVGDFDGQQTGYGLDEVVVTQPRGFSGDDWPDVYRWIGIYSYNTTAKDLEQQIQGGLPDYSRYTFLDTLAVGDLDMDGHNELVFAGHTGTNQSGSGYVLYVYKPIDSNGNWDLSNSTIQTLPYTSVPRNFSLALGDFTGKSIRVGPPTYRVQKKMTTPVILLNMPPLHKDIINENGTNTLIQVASPASAVFQLSNQTDSKTTFTSSREYSLSTGFEMSAGAGGFNVKESLDNTYKETYTNLVGNLNSVNVSASYTADNADMVIHNETDYAIWEYPVYGLVDGDASVPRTISVIWPLPNLPGQTNLPDSTADGPNANQCDENFYAPDHQLYNAWSYDAVGTPNFKDLDPQRMITSNSNSGGGNSISLTISDKTDEQRTAQFNNQISAGLEFSYQNELNVPLLGKAFDFSFRAYANGTYGNGSISTFESTMQKQVGVSVNYPSVTEGVLPGVTAYLYWSKAGYLVLDYQTDPNPGTTFWSVYNKPDPAFILPWYGFPDLDGTQHPTCVGKQYFTHDIQVEPNYAQNGQEVTLTATVRNFSPVTVPNSFTVQFYLGDPSLNHPIGSCLIGAFNRAQGAQQCSTPWVVNGASGTSRVYAVIDFTNAIPAEMHQQGDLINNNVGYGLLNVAGGDTFDPGLNAEQSYQVVPYQQAPGLSTDLYLPTNNLSALKNSSGDVTYSPDTVLIDLSPAASGITGIVGKPFTIGAFLNNTSQYPYKFQPAPAVVMMQYRDSDLLPGMDEADLKLYRQEGSHWVDATCPGYEIARFPDDNRLAVPICQAGFDGTNPNFGVFALSDDRMTGGNAVYIPMISR